MQSHAVRKFENVGKKITATTNYFYKIAIKKNKKTT